MTQRDIDFYVEKGYFATGDCRSSDDEEIRIPKTNETVVFHNFVVAGLRFPLEKVITDILNSFKVQLHQLTPNSIPHLLNYIWSCCLFGGEVEADSFCQRFELQH